MFQYYLEFSIGCFGVYRLFGIQECRKHPEAAYRKLKVILKHAELPLIRFHDLRHTFATHAMKGGVDAKTLSGLLGHTNASFTLDTYTHVTSDMQKNASAVVGNMMQKIMIKE